MTQSPNIRLGGMIPNSRVAPMEMREIIQRWNWIVSIPSSMVKYMVWLTKDQGERRETSTDEAYEASMRESEEMGKKPNTRQPLVNKLIFSCMVHL